MPRLPLFAAVVVFACAPRVSAQTTPLPAASSGEGNGFLTRAAWLASVATMTSGDPRFAWSVRTRFDLDLAQYPRGRVNALFDNEAVFGRERREFDFNHGNLMFETSSSVRLGGIDASLVLHHTSRHVVDRQTDAVVAWNSVAGRAVRPFAVGRSVVAASAEYHRVVQHTYVDYTWTSQFTIRLERPLDGGARLFASGSGGLVGVDRAVLNRDRQKGGRAEGGIHLPAQRAALDLFAAYERRIDGYPLARVPSRWLEVGFRLASP